MSLETKIEALTIAIEKLTAVINSDIQQDFKAAVTAEVAKVVETVTESTLSPQADDCPFIDSNETIDFEAFKSACLDYARDPKIGKVKVKEVLAEFGAAKASDIDEASRQAVLAKLGGL